MVQYGSHWLTVAIGHLKCDCYKMKCAVGVKYTLDFSDFVQKKVKYMSHFFILITCLNDHIWIYLVKYNMWVSEVAQSCLTFCCPMDYSLSGSSVHGILQARILEWVAISFSQGIFLTQGSNPGLPHYRQMLYHLSHQGSPNLNSIYSASYIFMTCVQ